MCATTPSGSSIRSMVCGSNEAHALGSDTCSETQQTATGRAWQGRCAGVRKVSEAGVANGLCEWCECGHAQCGGSAELVSGSQCRRCAGC
jgi:hypothetical protein